MTSLSANHRRLSPWRLLGWGTIALLLSIPAIFRFPWTASDFIIMGMLLGSVGLGIEFLVRLSGSLFVRLGSIMAVVTSFLTIWVNLAVGMIGDDEPYNWLFLVPMSVAAVGGVATKLHPTRMVKVSLLAAALQAGIGLGGYGTDPRGAILSALFAIFWLLSGALFRAGDSR